MAKKIQKLVPSQAPTLLDAAKGNELIDAINDLITSRGVGGIQVTTEANGRLVISAEDIDGVPSGFDEEELDIVESDNSAGTRIFLTKTP